MGTKENKAFKTALCNAFASGNQLGERLCAMNANQSVLRTEFLLT
jgi:hypothetical protein